MSRSLVCLFTVLAVAVSACTSMHQVPVLRTNAGDRIWPVKAGEIIRIVLSDASQAEFRIQEVNGDVIVAVDGRKFEHNKILSVERREVSGAKTAGATIAGMGALFFVLVVGAAAALLSSIGGGH